jgi:hypothetical protein
MRLGDRLRPRLLDFMMRELDELRVAQMCRGVAERTV